MLTDLLIEYQDCFAQCLLNPGKAVHKPHCINTGNHPPIRQPPYRSAWRDRELLAQDVAEMLQAGVIRRSESPWAFPTVVVIKKDGSRRICIDYHRLNAITARDAYPAANIEDNLDALADADWISTLDLTSGYWQIPVLEEDKQKTAFITHDGLYKFNAMPFGLMNAPTTFQQHMRKVLGPLSLRIAGAYLNDIQV